MIKMPPCCLLLVTVAIAVTFLATFLVRAPLAHAIDIQKIVSPKGLTAWLVEDHSNPIITVNFAFRGAAALDPAGKEGIANLVASTLDEGAGDLDSQAFQRALEDLSVSLSFRAGQDSFSGSLRTLTRNRDRAFELLKLALTRPRFDADAVARVRSQILAGLRRRSENPGQIAGRTLLKTLFPGHSYGNPVMGSAETVPVIKIVDLRLFQAQRLAKDNLVLSVVGDVTADGLGKLLDSVFGSLPETASPWKLANIAATAGTRTIVIDKPIPQSVIRFGQGGIKRNDPDFFAAYIMNYVLGGGGFESRLYKEVREKRGLAYSVYSYLSPYNHGGLIMGGSATANTRAAETIKILKNEWRRMADQGLTQTELDDAKIYLTGSYPLRFSSSRQIAAMMTGIQLERLGINYIDQRNSFINAVTLDDVNRVAKNLLDADTLTLVVVGQPDGVQAEGQ